MTNENKNLNTIGLLKSQLNTPKTETRIVLNDWQSEQAEVKTSKLSPAARNKVVNRSGSNYLSESHGSYGPCSWDNPNCECWIGQGLIPLHLACPATNCGGDGRAYQWVHHNCNGRIYINTTAYLRCMSCYTQGYITKWSFSCRLHPGKFWETSTDDCVEALSTVLKLYPNKSSSIKKIIRQISNTLMDNDGGY